MRYSSLFSVLGLILTLNFFVGIPYARASVSVSFTAHAVHSAPGALSDTFTALSIGTASADRYVVIVFAYLVVPIDNVPTCTIGGITATTDVHQEGVASANPGILIARALVTSGTTADIVCTKTGNAFNRDGVGVYAITGTDGGVFNTNKTEAANVTESTTINIAAGGVVIAGGYNSATAAGNTATWTGLATKDYDETQSGNVVQTGAHDSFVSASTGTTMKAVWTGATNDAMVVVASYQSTAISTPLNFFGLF